MLKENEIPNPASKAGQDAFDSKSKDAGSKSKPCKSKGFRRGKKNGKAFGQKGGNAFEFWNDYPELMEIATRFPWMHIAGTPLKSNFVNANLPNVAVQDYYPIPGVGASATDPLNLMFRSLYLDMHRKYRGIGQYRAPDIAITVLCIESVHQLLAEAARVYGILNSYPIMSRIEPEGLVLALGYTQNFVQDVAAKRADFRYRLNRLILKAARLPLPNGMNFFKSHLSLNGFIYKDSEDVRADLIAFRMMGYYTYENGQTTNSINSYGTAMLHEFKRQSYISGDGLLDDIEAVIDTLLSDDDILRITSDFIACYGTANMQVLSVIDEGYTVVPIYDAAILSKWHNSERISGKLGYRGLTATTTTITVTSGNDSCFAVYQEGDAVVSYPCIAQGSNFQFASLVSGGPKVLVGQTNSPFRPNQAHVADTWEASPSQATICEAMLWKAITHPESVTISSTTYWTQFIDNCGVELMTTLHIYKVSKSTLASTITVADTYIQTIGANTSQLISLMHFDWHPYFLGFSNSNTAVVTDIIGDTDNVTTITEDVIEKVLDAALLSAFKVSLTASSKGE